MDVALSSLAHLKSMMSLLLIIDIIVSVQLNRCTFEMFNAIAVDIAVNVQLLEPYLKGMMPYCCRCCCECPVVRSALGRHDVIAVDVAVHDNLSKPRIFVTTT